MMDSMELLSTLNAIDPKTLSSADWLRAGMAFKASGLSAKDWDEWCRRDPERYNKAGLGECEKRWASFRGHAFTPRTVYKLARESGWRPPDGSSGWRGSVKQGAEAGFAIYDVPPLPPQQPPKSAFERLAEFSAESLRQPFLVEPIDEILYLDLESCEWRLYNRASKLIPEEVARFLFGRNSADALVDNER